MRIALALLACAVVSVIGLLACRARLPVDHLLRPAPSASEAPEPTVPALPPVPPLPPVAVAAPLLHVEYYQISDG
jgi:hypothetical protein